MPFEQILDADQFVDRFTSISYVAALPDRERQSIVRRLRSLAARAAEQPLRLGYEAEAYLYKRQ